MSLGLVAAGLGRPGRANLGLTNEKSLVRQFVVGLVVGGQEYREGSRGVTDLEHERFAERPQGSVDVADVRAVIEVKEPTHRGLAHA